MPLPTDEKLITLSQDILAQFDTIFGLHSGFRPAHAKGILASGHFTPAPDAASLTKAPHILRDSTPVSVRFSNSTGLPLIPDNDPNANPKGLAVRFHLAEHVLTDIVSHSTDGFPTSTAEEFLEFLRAITSGGVAEFLGSHPAALAYVHTPKPTPVSFAKEAYFGVTAMRFTNSGGSSRFGRYRLVPDAGIEHLDDLAAAGQDPNFLIDEITARLATGPVSFAISVQTAEDGDVVDNATIHWPEDRPLVPFGTLSLTGLVDEQQAEQRKIIFDPIPRVDGIEPSDDPLLEIRAALYLISGRRRRA